ncbi:MBOAT, membrane-bound O-acyltransferase family-domain-containing protein [Coniella lustricola]|uniref:MBOAT, membrane-bound O-acyltransferase family-domain-containing protein n=1 Tax=Coniella lustricola TaxID=2025994 RepID=A0A2T3A5K8_9PEZI|nr:MBOAT, membrane-bound O-acyltransferase family-domain-containing protein [Coniella lustricola]
MLPFIHAPFVWLASSIGAGPDELKLIFSILISYPLAGALKRIPDAKPAYKNLFIAGTGIFFLVGLFDLWAGLRTVLIAAGSTYGIAYFLRGSPYMPWIGFVFLMAQMSVNQLERQFANNPASVDITGAQMVLVMKLSAFCWNIADGTLSEDQLSDFQKDRVLHELPDLLDYAGWVFFFPALLCGPAMDFAEYRRWLDTSMFEVPTNVDPSKKPPTRKKRKIPRSATPAMWKLAGGLVWILCFLNFSGMYSPELLVSDDYSQYGVLRRVWIMHMTNFTARMKYYGVWSLTEGACILTGIGYNGVDPATGRISWDRVQNVNPWGVETAQNTRAYLGSWNIKTNLWLRNYIYLRVTPIGKKPGFRATLATFVTSAVWHGFYPGYYLSFVLASFIQNVAKNFRRYFRPFVIDPQTHKDTAMKPYYDVFSYLVTQLAFSFATTPFIVLGFADSVKVWANVYFYCVVGVTASSIFFSSPGKRWIKNKLEERNNTAGVQLKKSTSTESLATGGSRDREGIVGPGLSSDVERDVGEMVGAAKGTWEVKGGKVRRRG